MIFGGLYGLLYSSTSCFDLFEAPLQFLFIPSTTPQIRGSDWLLHQLQDHLFRRPPAGLTTIYTSSDSSTPTMECISARVPYSQWRLRAFRQLLTTSQPLTAVVNRSISTSQKNLQLNESASKQRTETPGLESTRPSRRLPQSPLLVYPRPGAEKNRKRRPTPKETSQLSKNPWATALASPTRMCAITGARLPSDLLGTWGLVRQPDTGKLCMLPVGLMQDSLQTSKYQDPDSKAPDISDKDQIQTPELGLQGKGVNETSTEGFTVPAVRNKQGGRQLVLRMADLLPLIRSISEPLSRKGGKRAPVVRLLPFRWKSPQGPVTTSEERKLLWLDNTPEILLQCMRENVCKKLGAVLAKYKRVGTPNGVWRALDMPEYSDAALRDALGQLELFERIQCGGVLLLGSKNPAPAVDASQAKSSLDSVTLTQTGSNVPVFDLSVLLSGSDLHTLRESHGQFEHSALFFRPDDQAGIDAMISLWKLKRLLSGIDL